MVRRFQRRRHAVAGRGLALHRFVADRCRRTPPARPSGQRRVDQLRADLPRLHRRARRPRRGAGSDPRRRKCVRPAAEPADRRIEHRLRHAGHQHVAAAALSPRGGAAYLRAAAQPAVDRHDRRRPRLLHRPACGFAGVELQLRRAARSAGADGRRADAAPDGARHRCPGHAGAARHRMARLARGWRRPAPDDAGRLGGQRVFRPLGARR